MTQAITETSHNQQISTKFEPTENQNKWAMKALEMRTSSPTEIADALGMDRGTYYRWLDDPSFRAWWNDLWEKYYEHAKHRLLDIGMRKSETDHAWWRDMMETFGLRKPENQVPQNVNQINLIADAFSKHAKERGVDVTGTVSDDSKE